MQRRSFSLAGDSVRGSGAVGDRLKRPGRISAARQISCFSGSTRRTAATSPSIAMSFSFVARGIDLRNLLPLRCPQPNVFQVLTYTTLILFNLFYMTKRWSTARSR
jgi:hypothetical protein